MCAFVLTGCLPIGWVSPPAKLDGGIGAVRQVSNDGAVRYDGTYDVRASVVPLQLMPEDRMRLVDVELGYGMHGYFTSPRLYHGPFAGAGVLFPIDASNARLGFYGQLHALTRAQSSYAIAGGRVTGRVTLEFAGHTEGPFDACDFNGDAGFCGVGMAYGEGGAGFYAEAGYGIFDSRSEAALTAGFFVRIPATLGAGVLCLSPAAVLEQL